ncbi:MAG: hypothetical protein VX793_07510 [Pseudomonadota bacterium]|nr:hypothetical protein [Pseudomonadota bacterium]
MPGSTDRWRRTVAVLLLMQPLSLAWATQPCPMAMRSANWWWGGPVLAVTLLAVLFVLVLAGFGWRHWRSLRARVALVLAVLALGCVVAIVGLGAFVSVMLVCY